MTEWLATGNVRAFPPVAREPGFGIYVHWPF